MATTLYEWLQEHHSGTPAGRVEQLVPRWPDDLVFGPARAPAILREATGVETCLRCWTQQSRGLPCWHCGGPTQRWEPPDLADSDEPAPATVTTTTREGRNHGGH